MNKLLIAHRNEWALSDEATQLHDGLRNGGWDQAGIGFDDDCVDIPTLIGRHRPDIVYIDDPREWRNDCSGHPPGLEFTNWRVLKDHPEIHKVTTVKDAGTLIEYQREFAEAIGVNTAVIYYANAEKYCPWLSKYRQVRTRHSIDATVAGSHDIASPRKRCIVSGMTGKYYPLRTRAIHNANELGCDVLDNSGYTFTGSGSSDYLSRLHGYKVSIATSSKFGFALRKIIESVAMGCSVITDLPAHEKLPGIDSALIRVSPDISIPELKAVIDKAESKWSMGSAWQNSISACNFYDWRRRGMELSEAIESTQKNANAPVLQLLH